MNDYLIVWACQILKCAQLVKVIKGLLTLSKPYQYSQILFLVSEMSANYSDLKESWKQFCPRCKAESLLQVQERWF